MMRQREMFRFAVALVFFVVGSNKCLLSQYCNESAGKLNELKNNHNKS
jgi:hypothetical protein